MRKTGKLTALVLAAAMVLGMAGCREKEPEPSAPTAETPTVQPSEAPAVPKQSFKAGTYTSEQMGHNDVVIIEATFSDNAITEVKVAQHAETPGICEKPIEEIPAAIVANQSLAVDTVTGATVISQAILDGVADCAQQAGGDVEALKSAAVAPTEKNGQDEELTTDVLVIGGGASGSSAALTALQAGAQVVLLEKTSTPVGAGTAGASIFAAGSRLQKADGNEVSEEWLYDQYMKTSNYQANGALVRSVIRRSGETVDWLLDNGVNLTNLPAGMQSGSLEMEKLNPATANAYVDGGIVAINHLHDEIRKAGGKVLYETPAHELLTDGGKVVGAVAQKADGGKLTVKAKSVVIATGGFTNNPEMLAEYFPNHDFGRSDVVGGAEGDGLRMAWAAGAGKTGVVAQCYGINPATPLGYIDPLRMPLLSGALFVNNQGTRFCNEFTLNEATAGSNVKRSMPNEELYCIFDQNLVETVAQKGIIGLTPDLGKTYEGVDKSYVEVGWPSNSLENAAMVSTPNDLSGHIDEMVAAGFIVKADTIGELAEKMEMPKLVSNVERYNELCAKGVDEDFFKDAEYMDAVNKGPFYAVGWDYVNFIGTLGGVTVDETLQATTQAGDPIENLWVVGLDAGGMYGNSYVYFEGGTLGFAYISGRIAGEQAAMNAQK